MQEAFLLVKKKKLRENSQQEAQTLSLRLSKSIPAIHAKLILFLKVTLPWTNSFGFHHHLGYELLIPLVRFLFFFSPLSLKYKNKSPTHHCKCKRD